MTTPLKVLIVDDSATVRRVLIDSLIGEADLHVVGQAPDPYVAREMIASLRPDVITLDLDMPRMDGLSFLAQLMQHRPMPVVVISSLTARGSQQAMRALELGAVEVMCKPGSAYGVAELGRTLGRALRAAATVRFDGRPRPQPASPGAARPAAILSVNPRIKLLAIGASTGGTEAIRAVMERMPANAPGTIIVQHMPPMFTTSFAKRLNDVSQMTVIESAGGEQILPGLAFVAPGGHHLIVARRGPMLVTELRAGPAVHFQKPAVDVAFRSVAQVVAAGAVGVLLTGMGKDGAAGLLAMRQAGAPTIVQDEKTCVVYGMPKVAVEMGAAGAILPLDAIAAHALRGDLEQRGLAR